MGKVLYTSSWKKRGSCEYKKSMLREGLGTPKPIRESENSQVMDESMRKEFKQSGFGSNVGLSTGVKLCDLKKVGRVWMQRDPGTDSQGRRHKTGLGNRGRLRKG